jgi:hypothetical protein
MATALTEASTGILSKNKTLWHRSAPRQVAKRCPVGDPSHGWTAWQSHLAGRKRPELPPFLAGRSPAILWAWPDAWGRADVAATIASPIEPADSFANRNGVPPDSTAVGLSHTLQTLALAYALPTLASQMSADCWWKLADTLHAVAVDAQSLQVDWEGDAHEIVQQQLLAAELPLALGYLFPELAPFRVLRKPARRAFSESLVQLTDGEGLLHARMLPVLGPLWACWTRARWLGERLKRGCWSARAEVQYEWLVRHAIRLIDHDGRFVFCGNSEPLPNDLLATALELVGDQSDCAAAAAVVSSSVVPEDVGFDDDDLPASSLNSEWSAVSVLAADWSVSAPRLALAYAEDPMSVSLIVGRSRLLTGPWTHATTCDGKPVLDTGDWEQICWETNKNCDYLELSIDLEHGLRLERQVLLARTDQVLYMADIVVTGDDQPHRMSHSFSLPLGRTTVWRPEAETRDGVLADSKPRAAVLPLALPEWRCDTRGGSLEVTDAGLTLAQETTGRALCCPLIFDLTPRRISKERTWRQLTVGESLHEVACDIAVGYRGQSGRDQWLIYRSLTPAANRSVLGQNISSEFCAGRFLKTGRLSEWIEIEAE